MRQGQKEAKDIFLSLFKDAISKEPEVYLKLVIADIKEEKKAYIDRIDDLSDREGERYKFPSKHL